MTSTERSSNEFQSEVRKSELDYSLFERSVKWVSNFVAFSTSLQGATTIDGVDRRRSRGPAFVSEFGEPEVRELTAYLRAL